MKNDLKARLLNACTENIEERIASLQDAIQSITESLQSETKSSVGDKYETGRAMLQREEAKNKTLLFEAQEVKNQLAKIDTTRTSPSVGLGSLVQTDKGSYYISIGIGKVQLDGKAYYCLSSQSPIGKKLMRKQAGDEIEFNGRKLKIEEVW